MELLRFLVPKLQFYCHRWPGVQLKKTSRSTAVTAVLQVAVGVGTRPVAVPSFSRENGSRNGHGTRGTGAVEPGPRSRAVALQGHIVTVGFDWSPSGVDAHEFKPARWLEGRTPIVRREKYLSPTRICSPFRHLTALSVFAILEIQVVPYELLMSWWASLAERLSTTHDGAARQAAPINGLNAVSSQRCPPGRKAPSSA
ncbi:hypothetical protein DFH08DRAFT_808445 [Mycena albidolilacea]|uniref:Uncharacterized protein n=1 Tax=Mycena albidolilacea TaxID=1033008 RepID=A0AAD7A3I1_9AGAR|nr:hypothetical protein DFH08DRAFT_808445 [Mycena albidolilacea]